MNNSFTQSSLMRTPLILIAASAVILFGQSALAAPPTFHVVELAGPTDRPISGAIGINNAGNIVGYTQAASERPHATLWLANAYTPQTLALPRGADQSVSGYGSRANVINEANQIAGVFTTRNIRLTTAKWDSPSTVTALFAPTKVSTNNVPYDINNSGVIVGNTQLPTSEYRATLWGSDGRASYLAHLPGKSRNGQAGAINESGTIAGANVVSVDGIEKSHAVIWDAAGVIEDLGVPSGYNESAGIDVNENGQVLGLLINPSLTDQSHVFQPFIWERATGIIPIPVLPKSVSAFASKINNSGLAVGDYKTARGTERGYIWSREFGTLDIVSLIDPSDVLRAALDKGFHVTSINDSGYVVGYYVMSNGQTRAVVLIP